MLELTGVDHFLSPNFGGSYGFDAITVALLGRNVRGVFFGAIFFGAMYAGGEAMQPSPDQYSVLPRPGDPGGRRLLRRDARVDR